MKIDARGLACPQPVIKTREALNALPEGTVEILVDNEGAVGNLKRLAQSSALACEVKSEDNYWRVSITKKAGEEGAPADCRAIGDERFIVVGNDALGKDEALGKILIIRFFETMAATGKVPHTIFFINAGVRLTTVEDTVVPSIQKIAAMGTEIFSCGTCLKFFELESELKVGRTGSIDQVVDGMMGEGRFVWI